MIESVKWSINNSCNLRCPFCFADYKSEVLTLEDDFKIVDKLNELGVKHIDFFGKEPLLDDTIFKIMEYSVSKQYSFMFTFISNGVNLEKFREQIIASPCRAFSISYDFMNTRTFNVPIDVIASFPDDFHIEFSIDVHKEGYKELVKNVRNINELGIINSFYFNPIMPLRTESFTGISEDEYSDFINLLGQDILEISTVKIPYEFSKLTRKYFRDDRFYTEPFCTAGMTHFFIDSDGTAYGCNVACMVHNKKRSCNFLNTDDYTLFNTIYNYGKRECL